MAHYLLEKEIVISFIVPVYNTGNYIGDCLDSIVSINQIKKEIIIVNDGSTDNSLSRIYPYTQKYDDIIFVEQENQGLSEARNVGLRMAKGRYILFVDSDDFIIPDKLLELIAILDSLDIDILIGNYLECNNSGDITKKISNNNADKRTLYDGKTFYNGKSLNDASIIAACMKICRRDFLIENNIFFIKGLFFEDVPFSFLCSKYAKRMMQVEIPFYVYRQRSGSITKTPSVQKQLHKFFIVKYIAENIDITSSEFWANYIVSLYFDVLHRSKIKNSYLYEKINCLKNIRLKEKIKKVIIPFISLRAKKEQFNIISES